MQPDQQCRAAVVYHEMYDGRGFSKLTRSWGRYRAAMDKLVELGLIAADTIPDGQTRLGSPRLPYGSDTPSFSSSSSSSFPPLPVYRPDPATPDELAVVHSRPHIEHVLAMDAQGEGMFDRNDTPAWPGVFRRAALAFGGTLLAADLVAGGEAQHVFHVAGGLHHAHYDRVSGFCIFNDIVGAVRHWQTRYGYRRIAILDVDGHHGDGTQALLYDESVLTVSLHQYDGRFFPGTGALTERGVGPGLGYSLNLPLPRYSTDAEYLPLLEIGLAEVEAYQPDAIILQYGVDGHYSDRMVGLKLSTLVYEQAVRRVHDLAHRVCEGRLVVVGGGGYEPAAVARCWAMLVANLAGAGRVAELGPAYDRLHDQPGDLPESVPAAVEQVARLLQVIKQMV